MRHDLKRLNCSNLTLFSLILALFLVSTSSAGSPSSKKGTARYLLSQGYVDSTIQRALYIMNDAASVAGVGFHQREAIEAAKKIARTLKEQAKGDANERYVTWKVSELEMQIYLEEKDVLLQQMNKGISSVNELIMQFNAEVGNPRPDFAKLHAIHNRMGELDQNKANEIASSFNKRYKQISHEVAISVEKSLVMGDQDKSKSEFEYSLKNRRYLMIDTKKLSQLSNRLEALVQARLKEPRITSEADKAQQNLLVCNPGEVRKHLEASQLLVNEIKNGVPQAEWNEFSSRLHTISNTLARQEDSLVRVNLTILNSKGVQAANDYLQTTLKARGISHERAAYVDQAILSISTPAQKNQKVSSELEAVTSTDDNEGSIFLSMRATAKKKAQNKADSIRLAQEELARLSYLEQLRQDSIRIALQQAADKATQISLDIYTFLQEGRGNEAYTLFMKEKPFLSRQITEVAFSILSMSVMQAKGSSPQDDASNIVQISLVNEPAVSQKQDANRPDPKLEKNRKKAQDMVLQIYTMLEQNEIKAAYERFCKNRDPLQKYLDKEAFDLIAASVKQAWDYFSQEHAGKR